MTNVTDLHKFDNKMVEDVIDSIKDQKLKEEFETFLCSNDIFHYGSSSASGPGEELKDGLKIVEYSYSCFHCSKKLDIYSSYKTK